MWMRDWNGTYKVIGEIIRKLYDFESIVETFRLVWLNNTSRQDSVQLQKFLNITSLYTRYNSIFPDTLRTMNIIKQWSNPSSLY
ncbi:hypothetical protein SPOG_02220 [Schizosaccharomyces cryophilus OY26]|uniref:Uncharacterized protein n=1 Tax=Schizosaccharomyces cryophilus (strain OY26 / ATCC MYA-4695 / CBS 11777 / NBRC 106824 / NRRL Y48691) TaxID=653667 RepID=S9XBB2_SCHCR|nr:uncharacterized protein SPOG_02220 [Schizosaccharomyces cryophilus OY26]EPY51041.1 hypothetical protein SPOG_02220 [Schizosaccharomyces cryophilus OY26]